jgi:hypothetical protein
MKRPKPRSPLIEQHPHHLMTAAKHINNLQDMTPTARNVTIESNDLHRDAFSVPSGAFFQGGQM